MLDIPYFTTEGINDAFKAHADAQDRYLSCEIFDSVARYSRVCFWMSGTWRDDEGVDFEARKVGDGYRIVADDGRGATQKTKRLIEVVCK